MPTPLSSLRDRAETVDLHSVSLEPVRADSKAKARRVRFGMDKARELMISPTDSEVSSTQSSFSSDAGRVSPTRRTLGSPDTLDIALEAIREEPGWSRALIPPGMSGGSRLRRAARTGNSAKVAQLIACGASVHSSCEVFERTSLHYAAHYGQLACVKMLVELGSDVEAVDLNGETPIHLAAERGHADVIEWLAHMGGAAVDRRTKHGALPLHHAAINNCHAAAVALLALMKAREGGLEALRVPGSGLEPVRRTSGARRASWHHCTGSGPSSASGPGLGPGAFELGPGAFKELSAVVVEMDSSRPGTYWDKSPDELARGKGFDALAEIIEGATSAMDVGREEESDSPEATCHPEAPPEARLSEEEHGRELDESSAPHNDWRDW